MEISEGLAQREAVYRAELFLLLAEGCKVEDRELFEAFLEAAIIFGRTAIHRLQSEFKHRPEWKTWFDGLRGNSAIEFFREHRDYILKEGPPKVGQIISFNPIVMASQLYYFESADISATTTVREHLKALAGIVKDAKAKFSLVQQP